MRFQARLAILAICAPAKRRRTKLVRARGGQLLRGFSNAHTGRKMRNLLLAVCGTLVMCGSLTRVARADIEYAVTVDTTSVTGQSGYLDMEFNGNSLPAQEADLSVTNFSTDGVVTYNPADTNQGLYGPNASGSLTAPPNSLSFDNQSTSNGYTVGITFGTTINFDLTFSGPAFDSPDGTASGIYQLDFFDPTVTYFLLTNDPYATTQYPGDYRDFNAGIVEVNPDGTVTPIAYPNLGGGASAVTFTQVVPEPASLSILAVPIAMLLKRRR